MLLNTKGIANDAFVVNRARNRLQIPWKNGLGIMHEICDDTINSGSGSGDGDWTWRLSTADITRDVPFSSFPLTTRRFCIAEGKGVILTINGVDQRCEPLSVTTFRGDDVVFAKLIDGPSRVLNLIVKDSSKNEVDLVVCNHHKVSLPNDVNLLAVTALCGDATLSTEAGISSKSVVLYTLDSVVIDEQPTSLAIGSLTLLSGYIGIVTSLPKHTERSRL